MSKSKKKKEYLRTSQGKGSHQTVVLIDDIETLINVSEDFKELLSTLDEDGQRQALENYRKRVIYNMKLEEVIDMVEGEVTEKVVVPPPKSALFFMYLVYSRKQRESVMGDMEEDYHEAIELFGLRAAKWLYWKGVIVSLPASVKAAVVRMVTAMFSKYVG